MTLTTNTIRWQLEELNLLKCSLLPGEQLEFIPPTEGPNVWSALLDVYTDDPETACERISPDALEPLHFRVRSEGIPVWFEIQLKASYHGAPLLDGQIVVSVKGDDLARKEQEHWQAIVREKMDEACASEYPLYDLISTHLLSRLHLELDKPLADEEAIELKEQASTASPGAHYHALLTSHHLKSPHKRRSLQKWSNELSVSGFAKVGYPGMIYCEGEQAQVEKFVANVKAMQWLALRVRFTEVLEELLRPDRDGRRRWVEFEKVGEVVKEMRRLGREKYVVEMGIGSAGSGT